MRARDSNMTVLKLTRRVAPVIRCRAGMRRVARCMAYSRSTNRQAASSTSCSSGGIASRSSSGCTPSIHCARTCSLGSPRARNPQTTQNSERVMRRVYEIASTVVCSATLCHALSRREARPSHRSTFACTALPRADAWCTAASSLTTSFWGQTTWMSHAPACTGGAVCHVPHPSHSSTFAVPLPPFRADAWCTAI